jgi:hypothetical protein
MKVKFEDIHRSFIGHFVLGSFKYASMNGLRSIHEQLADDMEKDGGMLNVRITVNGFEIDLEKFVEDWEGQHTKLLKEQAKNIISERFGEISYLLFDLERRTTDQINQNLEEWEKE